MGLGSYGPLIWGSQDGVAFQICRVRAAYAGAMFDIRFREFWVMFVRFRLWACESRSIHVWS